MVLAFHSLSNLANVVMDVAAPDIITAQQIEPVVKKNFQRQVHGHTPQRQWAQVYDIPISLNIIIRKIANFQDLIFLLLLVVELTLSARPRVVSFCS